MVGVSAAECKQLRCFSVHSTSVNWSKRINYTKGEPSNRHSYNRNNVAYFGKLAQIILLEKSRWLRNLPHLFKEELLQVASNRLND